VEQTICEQAPAEPSPLCTPSELNPFAFYPPDHPTKPNQPIPIQQTESTPVSSDRRDPETAPEPFPAQSGKLSADR
jgi:hypothetical protein